MRLWLILLTLVPLVACNTPGPHFRGLPATRVTVDGSTFDIRVRDRLAEALRVNTQYAPRFGPIRAHAAIAMEQVSGCKVTEVRGDQALATGLLDCGEGPPHPHHLGTPREFICHPIGGYVNHGPGQRLADYDCSAL